ncbi:MULTISPECIES: hypothetical protein [Enterobacteriaceae]|uniref:hypothetical protein n=1 Tax=Enterobacteriaceae TaxID=543 RepID=UPI000735B91C|nr:MULTISPECIES: hypothetical protein [Enterobacteriaceae]ELO4293835.1 hypothetical protein [Escherichia coli]KTI09859.1 hypothetical protein ASV12_25320 [Enterobacter hormaechei subsp. xiangfangensis]KTI92965.1 hypothetical protein ASU94_09765 [Enterobacter hormaechei subsp. xiangfangensis]HDT3059144.1 hypothetical protein [Enterobacter hormaechei subsp. steigerwaltii]
MVSKLKQRRLRRLKADVAWWKGEASDLYARVMEQADEIAELRRLVIRVPMPVVVPAEIIQRINVKGAFAMGIERYGDAMLKLAKKEDSDG